MHHKIAFIDYTCNTVNGHHFSWRIKDNTLVKLRICFNNDQERLCLKVHYDEKYSEVWTSGKSARIRINQIVPPDFSDIERLKNKIRMMLVFS